MRCLSAVNFNVNLSDVAIVSCRASDWRFFVAILAMVILMTDISTTEVDHTHESQQYILVRPTNQKNFEKVIVGLAKTNSNACRLVYDYRYVTFGLTARKQINSAPGARNRLCDC